MLEVRIHCQFLPKTFDHLENFVSPSTYSPLNNDQKCIRVKNKRFKIIQEAKRTWLNYLLNAYEVKIQEYEQEYQNEVIQLETQLLENIIADGSALWNHVRDYIHCRTNRLKKETLDAMPSFRGLLLQNRQRSSSTKNTVGVCPEPYLDLISNPFDKRQWAYLCRGKRQAE